MLIVLLLQSPRFANAGAPCCAEGPPMSRSLPPRRDHGHHLRRRLCALHGAVSQLRCPPGWPANLLTDNAFLGIVAIGMTFVIISGGIDLSVGSVIGFTTVFVALC